MSGSTDCAAAAEPSKLARSSARISEQDREAGVEGGDRREVSLLGPGPRLGRIGGRAVRGAEEVAAHLGAQAERAVEVEAESGAADRRGARPVGLLERSARRGAGIGAEVD